MTYYVAECMEFTRYGELHEGIPTLAEAIELYNSIPTERLNAIKGIGIQINNGDYPIMSGGLIDAEALQYYQTFDEEYPQMLAAARGMIVQMPGLTVRDKEGILSTSVIDVRQAAEKVCDFEKKLDEQTYHSFYPDEEEHIENVMKELLTAGGREEFKEWLRNFKEVEDIRDMVSELSLMLEQEIKWPTDAAPLVRIDFSEDPELTNGQILSLNVADNWFRQLDQAKCQEVKEGISFGYNKTNFTIDFCIDGAKPVSYSGRQDFGDGDGGLLEHIEQHHRYYVEEAGKRDLEVYSKKDREEILESAEYVLSDLLPLFQYFCNLEKIEDVILQEKKINEKLPLDTDKEQARREYLEDMLKFISESRVALVTGTDLPEMPDYKNYQQSREYQSYTAHVLEEIKAEAKSYGMTVEEYAENGYEPRKNR